jgi:hypothetical protein
MITAVAEGCNASWAAMSLRYGVDAYVGTRRTGATNAMPSTMV